MSSPNHNPDLDDSINVTEAHSRVVREAAACAREKRIADNGREPTSLWVFVSCGIAALIAGGVLGDAGKIFAYSTTFRPDYVRSSAEGADASGPEPKAALAAFSNRGAKVYTRCGSCHGPDAKGDGSNFPSLSGSKWVTGDTQTLAMIILNGLAGPMSTGKTYGGAGGMAAMGAGMSPEDLAGVMTYLRNNFGNSTGDVVTVEMAKTAIELSAKREKVGTQTSAEEIIAQHASALPGDPIDPQTLVDPLNLTPVEAAP